MTGTTTVLPQLPQTSAILPQLRKDAEGQGGAAPRHGDTVAGQGDAVPVVEGRRMKVRASRLQEDGPVRGPDPLLCLR